MRISAHRPPGSMVVAITGGTGLIGRRVASLLEARGMMVRVLSRNESAQFHWNPDKAQITGGALEGVDAIVHLAGESVAGRWTDEKKRRIIESRRSTTEFLAREVQKARIRPVIVCASAIGFYGDRGDAWLTETATSGSGFLAETTVAWEAALERLSDVSSRLVILRIGVVLAADGGALPQMAAPIKLGIGSALGSGQQFVSWIHINDLARLICVAIDKTLDKSAIITQDLSGIYNAVTPLSVTNAELLQGIAAALGKPFFLPRVPALVLRMVLGQMSEMVLDSTRVDATKVSSTGFAFQHSQLSTALADLLGN
ncbi:MAG: TIGR01777 family oxidoreductase [Leptospirales bacterium]|nr:TIGR01777 family oxidoreductase [Leptospirales bacterium]